MNIKNRWSGAILAAILITNLFLSGCGSAASEADAGETDTGDFVEQEITLPKGADYVTGMCTLNSGALRIIAVNQETVNTKILDSSDNGAAWKKSAAVKLPIKEKKGIYWDCAGYPSAGGTVFYVALASSETSEGYVDAQYFIAKGGKAKKLPIKLPDEKRVLTRAEFSKEGKLIAADDSAQVYQIDMDSGNIQNTYTAKKSSDFSICGETVYLIGDKQIQAFSLETGKEVKVEAAIEAFVKGLEHPAGFEAASQRQKLLIRRDKNGEPVAYSLDRNGIISSDKADGKVLISGSETCMYDHNSNYTAFEKTDDKNFFLSAQTTSGSGLFRYVYQKDKNKNRVGLTFYSLTENNYFDRAISAYQRAHPGVSIKIETGITEDKAVTKSDALRTLNTEIMNGEGPDIINLGDIPLENLTENEILADLSKEVKESEKNRKLFTKVVEAYKKDGVIYAVPTEFELMAAAGNPRAVKASKNFSALASQLTALAKKASKTPLLDSEDFSTTALVLYQTYLTPELADKKTPAKKDLQDFYKQLKIIYDLCDKKKAVRELDQLKEMELSQTGGNGLRNVTSKKERTSQVTLCYGGKIDDLQCLSGLKKNNMDYRLLGTKNNILFAPKSVVGVNAKSKNVREAKAFVSFLLSKKGQETYEIYSFTFSLQIDQGLVRKHLKEQQDSDKELLADGETLDYPIISEAGQEEIIAQLDTVNTPANMDSLLKDIVMEQAVNYLNGERSLEDATDQAMKKIKLYLAE